MAAAAAETTAPPASSPARRAPAAARKTDVSRETSTGGGGGDVSRETSPFGRVFKTTSGVADNGAGFILGVLFFAWVVLPFVQGGPSAVKAVLLAKFVNKAPDGSWL